MQHEPFPMVPDAELDAFRAICEQSGDEYAGYIRNADNLFISARMENGRIVQWLIRGPLTAEEAAELRRNPAIH